MRLKIRTVPRWASPSSTQLGEGDRKPRSEIAVVDGRGTDRSPTRRGVREIVDGAFPPRTRIERAEGVEILRLRLEVREESPQEAAAGRHA